MAGATGENVQSPAISPRQETNRKPPRNRLSCQVTLLDGTVLTTDQLQVSLCLFNGFHKRVCGRFFQWIYLYFSGFCM